MTNEAALDAFAETLSNQPAPHPRVAAVLLADQLVLAGRQWSSADTTGEINADRAARSAMRGSSQDADDIHWGALVHPGAIIWPTVIEVGLARGASGVAISHAASVGHEAMVRLALAIGSQDGFHLTSLVGGVGGAAAASMLLEGVVNADALGHALSVVGGSSGALIERSGTRSFHRGHAVRTGLWAAIVARDGVGATRGDLERGGGALPAWDGVTPATLVTDAHALAGTSIRPLPTSGWNHAAYEAARDAAVALEGRITRIVVAVPESTRRASSAATDPPSEAWHHLSLSVARAIRETQVQQPIGEILPLIEIVPRDEPGAHVTVEAVGGETSAEVCLPLGHPYRRPTEDDLARKWGLSAREASTLLDQVEEWLASPAVAPPPPNPDKEQ